ASADRGGSVRLWEPASGKALGVLPFPATSVAWSADGRTLACAGEPGIRFWDADAVREGRPALAGRLEANSTLAWSSASNLLALSAGNEVQLRDGASYKPLASLVGHTAAVRCLAFRPDGKALATAGIGRTVR